ncbi:hypothetical protein MRX96_059392 [Rhipicephalus microplus]
MSKDAYDGLAQNLTEKMKRTLTPASDGVFSKNCLGMVTVKGTICVHCRYLRKSLLARKSKLKKKRVTHNLSHKLRMTNQKTKRIASRLCTLAGQVRAMKEENSRLNDETFLGRIKELLQSNQEAPWNNNGPTGIHRPTSIVLVPGEKLCHYAVGKAVFNGMFGNGVPYIKRMQILHCYE